MIAVDIMGGDNAPHAIMDGAVCAARRGVPVLLCGPEKIIQGLLPTDWQQLPISFLFCDEWISMDDEPTLAIRKKSRSSLVSAMKAVVQGQADAFFSAGNSGAVLLASVFFSGRVPGVHRPAVGAFLPTKTGSFFCLDMGGNVDCKPEDLAQFALMGSLYVQLTKGIVSPRIALLSNGHEPYKGSDVVKKTHRILSESSLRFIGNIEARELGKDDVFEVLVCDGFTGNVLLKAIQGTASTLFSLIKHEANRSWWRRLLLWLNREMFHTIKHRLDYAATGAALLLGVRHPVFLAHGRSDARAIENGILLAHAITQEIRVPRFNEQLATALKNQATFFMEAVQDTKDSKAVSPS